MAKQLCQFNPIKKSDDGAQKLVAEFIESVPAGRTAIISGGTNPQDPIIVDDVLLISGARKGGFSAVTDDPMKHLGQNPSVCYTGVAAINVTDCVRADGNLIIQVWDWGGYTYASSELWLHII
jgi:hypothetical protein